MKRLLLTLLAVAWLATTSFAEEGQVVVVKKQCAVVRDLHVYWCKTAIKNIGETDVRDVTFNFTISGSDKKIKPTGDSVPYLPSKETVELNLTVPLKNSALFSNLRTEDVKMFEDNKVTLEISYISVH